MSAISLKLPNNYVDVDRDEMEYVDGGGTISFTIDIAGALGTIAGGLTAKAVTVALQGINLKIGAAIVFGTAGTGTWIAAAACAAFAVAIPFLAKNIVTNWAENRNIKPITWSYSGTLIPNLRLSI